jgi:hypothetical protein
VAERLQQSGALDGDFHRNFPKPLTAAPAARQPFAGQAALRRSQKEGEFAKRRARAQGRRPEFYAFCGPENHRLEAFTQP